MPSPLENDVRQLSAKVTALTMLIESMYVGRLSKENNPVKVGEEIVKGLYLVEKKALDLGDEEYSLMISDAVSSLIDRAVARAVLLRSRERPD